MLFALAMLATGNSAVAALTRLRELGARQIKLICLLAAPEGLKTVTSAHPDVEIFVAAIDSSLNDHAYILPELGEPPVWHQVKKGCLRAQRLSPRLPKSAWFATHLSISTSSGRIDGLADGQVGATQRSTIKWLSGLF